MLGVTLRVRGLDRSESGSGIRDGSTGGIGGLEGRTASER